MIKKRRIRLRFLNVLPLLSGIPPVGMGIARFFDPARRCRSTMPGHTLQAKQAHPFKVGEVIPLAPWPVSSPQPSVVSLQLRLNHPNVRRGYPTC